MTEHETTIEILKSRRDSIANLFFIAYMSDNKNAQNDLGRYLDYLDRLIDDARNGIKVTGIESIETICPDRPANIAEIHPKSSLIEKVKRFLQKPF